MARIKDIKNLWGVQGGINPQRTDLWQVDLSEALLGLDQLEGFNANFDLDLPRYFVASITLPEQKIKAEEVPRDSRRYMMPSLDEPLDSFKISFIFDDTGPIPSAEAEIRRSKVVKILDAWRTVVRAGRGAVGSGPSIPLNSHYSIEYQFPINVFFCRGYSQQIATTTTRTGIVSVGDNNISKTFDFTDKDNNPTTVQTRVLASRADLFRQSMQNGLELSSALRFENAWLAGYKIGDLSYEGARALTIDATFYADNLHHLPESEIES